MTLNTLLGKFEDLKNRDKRFLLIFDVDGTLRPDTVMSLDHRYPKISPDTARQLQEINSYPNYEVLILTARSYIDIFRSNLPNNLTKYCAFGKHIIENNTLKYAHDKFHDAYKESVLFIELVKDILGPEICAKLDFLVTPGDFAIYFEENEYEQTKKEVLKVFDILLKNSRRWDLLDFVKEIVIRDLDSSYTKGDAIWNILDCYYPQDLTHIFMFGDTNADYHAMEALRNIQKAQPQRRIKVTNICVGPELKEKELVDIAFESYNQTIEFVDTLYEKLKSNGN